jgi:hypothetical protein
MLSRLGFHIDFTDPPMVESDDMKLIMDHNHDDEMMMMQAAKTTQILSAAYAKSNLELLMSQHSFFNSEQQEQLLQVLKLYEDLFQATLGMATAIAPIKRELKPGAEPVQVKMMSIPQCHYNTLKEDVECLCKLKLWSSPSFVIPKKEGMV